MVVGERGRPTAEEKKRAIEEERGHARLRETKSVQNMLVQLNS